MTEINKKFEDLDWTGERYLPGLHGDIAAEHLHRYALARELVRGKDVLDIACGEGYGSHLLSDVARSVIGVDLAEDVVRHANMRYVRPGLQFKVGSCADIPINDQSIDIVVSFETIEHHAQHFEMLSEFKRVLRPNGLLIISSPDKHEYSEVPARVNPFHVKELYLEEFQALLRTRFRHIVLYGQRVYHGSVVAPLDSDTDAPWYTFSEDSENIRAVPGLTAPLYFIAVATDGSPASLPVGIFSDPKEAWRLDQEIAALVSNEQELSEQIVELQKVITERNRQLDAYRQQAVRLTELVKVTQDGMNTTRDEVVSLNQATFELSKQLDFLNRVIAERDAQLLRANSTIAMIVSSKSWRFTSYFRRLLRSVRPASDFHPGIETTDLSVPRKDIECGHNVPDSNLPTDGEKQNFDPDFYLRLYPDVRENFAGDPYDHYVAHGKQEGRLGCLPSIEYSASFDRLNPDRDTVLVVSHEASTTGAPVLSLNIISELKDRYNVIVLLLNGGTLFEDLKATADIIVGPIGRHAGIVLGHQIDNLLSQCRILFAIISSVESRIVLPELARHFVPSVVLIHEFASYTRPRYAIADAIYWASETVFSAEIVRDSAVSAFPDLAKRLPVVIPQGQCSLVLTRSDKDLSQRDADKIRRTFRPQGWPEETLVVLGIGSVHIRKGVDLFVATAARVSQTVRCRFIWIGSGYDPDQDREYSVYLEDQIKRAGLTEIFAFMGETSQVNFAYEMADVLVVSSRLDPLPNVSIDAVTRGLPIVCFDKATGIADILGSNGMGKECVAPYLDVERLAECVIAFLESPSLRQSVGSRLRQIGERTFNMSSYVEKIEKIALAWTSRSAQESLDCATIASNVQLNLDYMAGLRAKDLTKESVIRRFVRSWENGFDLRKPYPGFHPGIYMEQCGVRILASNPLAHCMRAGSPLGPWSYEVIGPEPSVMIQPGLSAALHVHVFYKDLVPAIIDTLNANSFHPDLFISFASNEGKEDIEAMLRDYCGQIIEIQVVPNRGRDIGAFLTAFGDRLTSQYEFIGHFHTKKTVELADREMGKTWFSFLLENLIGGRNNMADTILARMSADPSIGLVFPDDPHVVGWSNNRESALRLAVRMGLPEPHKAHFNFPVGTMFWARSASLRPLTMMNLEWSDYPAEPLARDGTTLHAIERLLPFIADAAGFRSVVTNVPGVTR